MTDDPTVTATPAAARPRASRREDLLTTVFATWLIVGTFVDGWAHNNDKPETLFTPWHAQFYSGFLASAAWMAWIVQRRPGGAGLIADVLYRRLRPGPDRPWSLRAWAAIVPAVMWLAYFALLDAFRSVGWSVELWSGVTVMSAMAGLGLALLMVPPPIPSLEVPAPT